MNFITKNGGELIHVGYFVYNAEAAKKMFDVMFDVDHWDHGDYSFGPEKLVAGAPFKNHCAFGRLVNGPDIELVELVEGEDSYIGKHLKKHGEGISHLAFRFPSYDAWQKTMDELKAAGNEVVYEKNWNGQHGSYVLSENGQVVFELTDF